MLGNDLDFVLVIVFGRVLKEVFEDFEADFVIFGVFHEEIVQFEKVGKLVKSYELDYLCEAHNNLLFQGRIHYSVNLIIQ